MKNVHSHRKDEHVSLAEKFFSPTSKSGFDDVRLVPNQLPELNQKQINLATKIAGINLEFPFFIQAMTGGSIQTGKINQQLAEVAHQTHIAMAVGSQSVALKYPELVDTFKVVRKVNPNGILLANVGAHTPYQSAQEAINMIDANVLQVHVNVAQEVVMPEGDQDFHWLNNIKQIIQKVTVPVIIKSVGTGFSKQDFLALQSIGATNFDVGGLGGTNFIQIENARRSKKELEFLQSFGFSTVESLLESRTTNNSSSITATGGIRNSADIIKSFALGADNVGIAGLFLHILIKEGPENLIEFIGQLKEQLIQILLMTGKREITQLNQNNIILSNDLFNFMSQRNIK